MPLVPLAVAWLAGVLWGTLGPVGPAAAGPALGAAVASLGVLPLVWRDPRARLVGLAVLALWLGLGRALLALPPSVPPPDSLRAWNIPAAQARSAAAPVRQVRGRIAGEPVVARAGKATQLQLAVEAVQDGAAWRPASGGLLAFGPPFLDAGPGDQVECTGVVQDPPVVPGFDYATWLAQHGVESYMDHARVQVLAPAGDAASLLAGWRQEAGDRTARLLPQPESGLLRGIILGEHSAIDGALRQDFVGTGTAWILIISGVHLLLLLMIAFPLLRAVLMPWPSVVLTGVLVTLYAGFVGFGVPIARAALMAVLVLVARGLGRPATALNLLAIAALAFTVLDPRVVADVGFQLSFAAVAGMILLAPALQGQWRRWPLLGEALAASVAVELAIWPLEALHFGTFPLLAVPAGALGGLLLGPLMVLGSLQELAAWIFLPLGQLLAWLCWLPLFGLRLWIHGIALVAPPWPWPPWLAPATLLWYPLLAVWYVASGRHRAL